MNHEDRDPAPGDARAMILAARADADQQLAGLAAGLQRVCRGAVQGLPVTGAVVHLADADHELSVAAASGPGAARIGDLPFAMGVAPSLDAVHARQPVLVPDLAADGRWPGYASTVLEQGVRAVFALPLQVGAMGMGVLDLYADRAGLLPDADLAVALGLARLATAMTLAGAGAEEAPELAAELGSMVDLRPEVHQAQGMVMVTLEVGLAEALLRMRGHAFGQGVALATLAREVISGASHPLEWGVG